MSYQQYRPTNFKLLPEVVKNLLIINGLMYLATYVLEDVFGIKLTEKLGLYYFGSDYFRPYQLVTHLFMHGSLGHIFSNMFALWMFGNVLENYWGGKRFLTFYIITGLGAAFIHSLVNYYELSSLAAGINAFAATPSPEALDQFIIKYSPAEIEKQLQAIAISWHQHPGDTTQYVNNALQWLREYATYKENIPTVGASGAVFGVLLAFGMLFPNTLLYIYFAIPVKAKYFVIFYGLFELYTGFQNNPGDNVAHFAHLGGMLFGFILIKIWQKRSNRFY